MSIPNLELFGVSLVKLREGEGAVRAQSSDERAAMTAEYKDPSASINVRAAATLPSGIQHHRNLECELRMRSNN